LTSSKILVRDERCVYCKKRKSRTIDHIIPVNKGGLDEPVNKVGACKTCNSSKSTRNVFSWCLRERYSIAPIIVELLKKQLEHPKVPDMVKRFIRIDLETHKRRNEKKRRICNNC